MSSFGTVMASLLASLAMWT